MKTIAVPNLPERHVRLAAVSADATDIIYSLEKEGIEVAAVKALRTLPAPVASHSDLQLLHLGGNKILSVYEGEYSKEKFTKFGIDEIYEVTKLGELYPNDISLNFLLLNKCCFGLSSTMPLQLIKHCNHAGLQVINSRQGYARCSVAVVSQNAAITSDPILYNLLTLASIDTLKVGPGDILLPGYDTGFIGGCCGLIDRDQIAFTGNLNNYRYGEQVLAFLHKHKVSPVYLTNRKLLDIGGILPFVEDD